MNTTSITWRVAGCTIALLATTGLAACAGQSVDPAGGRAEARLQLHAAESYVDMLERRAHAANTPESANREAARGAADAYVEWLEGRSAHVACADLPASLGHGTGIAVRLVCRA